MSYNFPVVITSAGIQPQDPDSIRQQIEDDVASTNPGYSGDLPASLIEDILSTDVAAVVLSDRARVDLVNSLTAAGANEFLLTQLGQMLGILQGTTTNTTVNVVFTGPVGYVISPGFLVSDGTYTYRILDGGVISSNGESASLTAIATSSGSWTPGASTVTQITSSYPSTVTLTVTNPLAGTAGSSAETEEDYRARVMQANLAASMGMPRYIKTLLKNVSGVQSRLVAVQSVSGSGIKIICGGGDNYEVAYAIFRSNFDPSRLLGSTLSVTAFTAANPGQVTTDLNHGYATGQTVTIASATPTSYNGTYTITVIDEKNFTVGVDTSSYAAYTSGGVVTPNLRNVSVSLNDYPDTYLIEYVTPPEQTVAISVTWNTSLTNFTQGAAVEQLAQQPLADYINAIQVGASINVLELQATFLTAVASVIDADRVSKLDFSVSINGVTTGVTAGTNLIEGDSESYFSAAVADITINQG